MPGPQGKTAPRRHHRRHFEHHSPCREICPLHQHDMAPAVPGRRHGWAYGAAGRSRGAAAHEPPRSVPPGFAIRGFATNGAPRPSATGPIFQVLRHQLGNCDPTRAVYGSTPAASRSASPTAASASGPSMSGATWSAAVTLRWRRSSWARTGDWFAGRLVEPDP